MIRRLLVALLLVSSTPANADPIKAFPPGVRPLRGWIANAIGEARPLSATLDTLLTEVGARPLVVYVDELSSLDAPYDGRLSFIGASHGYRFLRIELRQLPVASAAAVLAHELQHVLEVAASVVASRQEFEALYRRIGVDATNSGGRRYDTAAAVASGEAAMRELVSPARGSRDRRPRSGVSAPQASRRIP